MEIAALQRFMREGPTMSGAVILIDKGDPRGTLPPHQGNAGRRRRQLETRGHRQLPRHACAEHERDDLLQRALLERHRVRRRLQRRAHLAVGAQPRAGQPSRAGLHARGNFADPAGRAGGDSADRRAGGFAARLRACRAGRAGLRHRAVSLSAGASRRERSLSRRRRPSRRR